MRRGFLTFEDLGRHISPAYISVGPGWFGMSPNYTNLPGGVEPLLYIVKWGLPIFCTKLFHFLNTFPQLPALSPLSQPVSSSRRVKAFRPMPSDSNQFHWPFSTGLDPALLRAKKKLWGERAVGGQTNLHYKPKLGLPSYPSLFFSKSASKTG